MTIVLIWLGASQSIAVEKPNGIITECLIYHWGTCTCSVFSLNKFAYQTMEK